MHRHDPGVRLRDIAASLGITERSAYGMGPEETGKLRKSGGTPYTAGTSLRRRVDAGRGSLGTP